MRMMHDHSHRARAFEHVKETFRLAFDSLRSKLCSWEWPIYHAYSIGHQMHKVLNLKANKTDDDDRTQTKIAFQPKLPTTSE